MVVGGYGAGGLTSVELLNSDGSLNCSLPNLPAVRYDQTQNGLISCGGGGSSSAGRTCVTFREGTWIETHNLANHRQEHTSWFSPEGVLLMGKDATSELLTDDGNTIPSFNLDYHTE